MSAISMSWTGVIVLLLALCNFEGALAHKWHHKKCPKTRKYVCDIKKCKTYWNICYAKKYHARVIKGGKCTWKKCHPKPPSPKKSPLPPVASPKKSPLPSPKPSPQPSPQPSPLPSPLPSPKPSPLPSPKPSPLPSPKPSPLPSPKKSPYPPVTECKKKYKHGKLVKKTCCQKFYEHGKVVKKVCWYYDEHGAWHKGL